MAKAKKEDDVDTAQKPKLQAVLLADPFLESFRPLTLDCPKVLFPLNNVRLLEYTLDFLATQNVEEVFVICTNDELDLYLEKNKKEHFGMEILSIKDTSLTNAGDALRELYKRNLIQSDPFLLLFGDCVTNMDLRGAMKAHQERHSKDSAAIMTLVLKEIGTACCSIQPPTQDLVVGMDSSTSRVLLYDNQATEKTVKLPCSFFKAHSTIEVRQDLMDTGVFICSPDVLGRFEDEFDYLHIAQRSYQSQAQDFVHNSVAEEEEGLQVRIHAHILPPESYAVRVVDESTYHTVSQDLLRRWCYPVVPDNNHYHSSDEDHHRIYKVVSQVQQPPQLYLYKESSHPSKIGRSSTLCGPGMLGSGGSVEANAIVEASVLGNNVYVHEGSTVRHSHLWDGVEVHAGATVDQAIIAQDCVIGEGATVSRGCVLGRGVVLGKGIVLPEFTRLTLQEDDSDDDFGDDGDWDDDSIDEEPQQASSKMSDEPDLVAETNYTVVGSQGKGHVWKSSTDFDDDDDDDDDFAHGIDMTNLQSIGHDATLYFDKRRKHQAEEYDDGFSQTGMTEDQEMEEHAFSTFTDGAFTFEDTPGAAATSAPVVFGRQKGVDVVKEMKEICLEFEETSPMENLAIELNSYKFSQNATYSDCTMASTLAMVERMEITADMSDGKLVSSLKSRLSFWAPLLQKMSIGIEEERAIISGLERVATTPNTPGATKLGSGLSFRFLLQTLHDEEVLSEEAILAWAGDRKEETNTESPVYKLFQLTSIQDFLEWLEEESEEEEEDSDDDSDDDSE